MKVSEGVKRKTFKTFFSNGVTGVPMYQRERQRKREKREREERERDKMA